MISSKNEEICAMGLSVFYSRAINFPVIKYDLSELDNMEDLMIIRHQCSQSLPLGNWEDFAECKVLHFKLREKPKRGLFEHSIDFFKLNILM